MDTHLSVQVAKELNGLLGRQVHGSNLEAIAAVDSTDKAQQQASTQVTEGETTMNLSEMQKEIEKRWGSSEYSKEFNARPDAQRDAHHAAIHLMKALGKISSELDDLDHQQESDVAPAVLDVSNLENALADLIICAARVGSRWPGAKIDIDKAVQRRINTKFPPKRACYWHDDCDEADAVQRKVDRETIAVHRGTPADR